MPGHTWLQHLWQIRIPEKAKVRRASARVREVEQKLVEAAKLLPKADTVALIGSICNINWAGSFLSYAKIEGTRVDPRCSELLEVRCRWYGHPSL